MGWLAAAFSKFAASPVGQYIISWELNRIWLFFQKLGKQAISWWKSDQQKKAVETKNQAALDEYEKVKADPAKSAQEQEDAFKKFINDTKP
jgi:hypothetical protein